MFEGETLIAGGCSFTDDENCPKWDYNKLAATTTKWPHLLGFKKVYNTAESGDSNDGIFRKIEDKIINENIIPDRIIIGLTEFARFRIPILDQKFNVGMYDFAKLAAEYHNSLSLSEKNRKYNSFFKDTFQLDVFKLLESKYIDRVALIEYHLRNLYHLANLCLIKNIKLHVFQMLSVYSYAGKKESDLITKLLKESNIIKIIKKNPKVDLMNWVNWGTNPIYLKNGKWVIGRKIHSYVSCMIDTDEDLVWGFGKDKNGLEFRDGHPNQKGHEKIAEWVLKNVNKD